MPVAPTRAESLFLEASALVSVAERTAFLDRECRGETELRTRVEAMLASQNGVRHFPEPDNTGLLDSTLPDTLSVTATFSSEALLDTELSPGESQADALAATLGARPVDRPGGFVPGQVIAGRYTLLEVLGEGGMGAVYRADQSQPVKRQVALKLIKAGMDSRTVLARFDAERQALALMDHPNIARVFDGGVTEANQPFFVMELVNGVSITEYCDRHRLPVRARLQLFVAVCQAVQHAHQKAIIHRDLKPGNVLVTEVDGRPTPKVIDFGVAKATEFDLTDQSLADTGVIVGTPTYMSPEQADPSSMDIDTRTDVYALGVILYELLAGSPPLEAKQFKRGAILEMLRMVREVDPPKPSTKVSTADALRSIAAGRDTAPEHLQRALRGDLDWIVMKALEKDRSRRYETPNGFAADILRHLAFEPVLAAPPSGAYRLRKFARKNRTAVIAASLVLLALVGGIAGTTYGLIQAKRSAAERQLALEQSEKDRRVADESYRLAREAVVSVADRLPDLLRKNLFARQAQKQAIAALGEAVGKQANMAAARRLPSSAMMAFHVKTSELAAAAGDWKKAETADAAAQQLAEQALVDDAVEKDKAKGNLALVIVRRATHGLNAGNKPAGAVLSLFHEALELQRQIVQSPTTGEIPAVEAKQSVAGTLYEIAEIHRRTQKFADAVPPAEEALALRREVANAPRTAYTVEAERKLTESLVQLGKLYTGLADDGKAEPYLKEAADRLGKLADADPSDQGLELQAARASREYGDFLLMRDRLADAAPRYAGDLVLVRRILGVPELIQLQSELSDVYYRTATLSLKRGERKSAAADYRRCRDIRQMLADAFPANDGFQSRLANALARSGDYAAAASLLEKLLARRPNFDTFNMGCNFALCADALLAGRPAPELAADDRKLYDAYRSRAVALVEKLIANGWKDGVKLATDPDLEALRDEPRFVALLARLKPPEPKKP